MKNETYDLDVTASQKRESKADIKRVSTALRSFKKVLNSYGKGSAKKRTGQSKFQRGAGVVNTKINANLQRCAVRWSYSANKQDGKWGVHGKYIERESASLEQNIEDTDRFNQEKDLTNEFDASKNRRERDDRYEGDASGDQRTGALRFANSLRVAREFETSTLHDLRELSSLDLVFGERRSEGVLQNHARDQLQQRETDIDAGVRRGSDGKPGKSRKSGRAAGLTQHIGFGSHCADRPELKISDILQSWQDSGDERLFKVILSPEFGEKLDLKRYTAEFIKNLEHDLKTKLQWVAADHYNTDKHHVHLTIRAVDDRGQSLVINPDYLKTGSRVRAQEVATKMIGYRTERDIQNSKEKQISQQRFTEIDRSIVDAISNTGAYKISDSIEKEARAQSGDKLEIDFTNTKQQKISDTQRENRLNQIKELVELEKLGLAEKIGEMKWVLKKPAKNAEILVGHGTANLDFKEFGAKSYYAILATPSGVSRTVWGADIERAINLNNIKTGDAINLEKTGKNVLSTIESQLQNGSFQQKQIEIQEWSASHVIFNPNEFQVNTINREIHRLNQQSNQAEKLISHGVAPFAHDSKNANSYFATLEHPATKAQRTVWGADIERVLADSKIGDHIELKKTGKNIKVKSMVNDRNGGKVEKLVDRQEFVVKKIDALALSQITFKAKPLLINFDGPIPKNEYAQNERLNQIRRLNFLTKIGLAEKVGDKSWRVNPSLESALRQIQKTGDRLKSLAENRAMITDKQAQLVVTDLKEAGQRVFGKLVGTGLDESTNRLYAMVEGVDGKIHYVSQPASMQAQRASSLKVGNYVSLEVVEHKTKDGQSKLFVKTESFGKEIPSKVLDRQALETHTVNKNEITSQKTVSGKYKEAYLKRVAVLEAAGAIAVVDNKIVEKSVINHDKLTYSDAKLNAVDFKQGQNFVGTVIKKGRDSIVVKTNESDNLVLTNSQLKTMGLESKFTKVDSTIAVLDNMQKESKAYILQVGKDQDQLAKKVNDEKINELDLIAIRIKSVTQPQVDSIVKERQALWTARCVDVKSESFISQASAWEKQEKMARTINEKGIDVVLQEMAKERQKTWRSMHANEGNQISGRVLLTHIEKDGTTTIVVDTGAELTRIRQNLTGEDQVRPGQRIRATGQEVINQKNLNQRQTIWRIIDLDRELAIGKNKGKDRFG